MVKAAVAARCYSAVVMRRTLKILVRVVAALIAGVAVCAGFGLWLLSRGPIELDGVAPYVASALSRDNGIATQIDHALLNLTDEGRIALVVRGVHLRRDDGGAVLTLDELALQFDTHALMTGVIAPTSIVVNRPELRLVRETDGSFHLGIGAPSGDSGWGEKLLGDLMRPPGGEGTLGYLTDIAMRDAVLTVDDKSLGVEWRADQFDLSLERKSDRTGGVFHAVTSGAGFTGNYIYTLADNNLVVKLSFTDVNPSVWASASPSLAGLATLAVPISGSITAEIDGEQLTLRDAIWDLSVGQGVLKNAAFAGGALAIKDAKMQAGYDVANAQLNLGVLAIHLPQGSIDMSGTADGVGPELLSGATPPSLDLGFTIAVHDLKADDLPTLWPYYAATDTRRWVVQHINDGVVDKLQAQVGVHIDLLPNAPKLATLSQFDGTMAFTGLTIEYFRPLPAVRNVSGTAHFDRTEIDFTATGGDLFDIKASAATARFYKLDTHDEQAAIQLSAQGPINQAFAILDTPPLGYATDMGIDPKRTRGSFTSQLQFAFPLVHDLPLSLVQYSANATLSGVEVANIMFGRDLTEGELGLKLDRTNVQASGAAKLAGVPLNLTWRQNLQPRATIRTRYDVKTKLDDAQRKLLGFDFLGDYVTGPIGVDATYSLAAAKRGEASATLDLTDSKIDLGLINWTKPSGKAATAKLVLDVNNEKATALRSINLTGSGIDLTASANFDEKGVSDIAVEHLIAGDTDLHGGISVDPLRQWRLTLAGKSLDASTLAKKMDEQPDAAQPALTIDAKLDRIILGPQRVVNGVTALLVSDGEHWQQASIAAKLNDKGNLNLAFGGPAGDRQFKLTTDDFGAFLKITEVYDQVSGGTFELTGHAEDRDGKRLLVSEAEGADYRVTKAPALARLLSVASLSGIGALLSGEGIPFNRLRGQVIFGTDKIALTNMRAYGGALGLNASGIVDREAGSMDIAGTLVPAYTLNSVIGDIPLLGLLVGGAGQGLFAANFRMYGPRDEPHVSVNPLSTLAPGVLRNLFLFSPGGP